MSQEIIRASNLATVKVTRPDGTGMECSGPAPDVTIIMSQYMDDATPKPPFGLQWLEIVRPYQGIMVAFGFFVLSVSVLLWATRPADNYYQPQSQGANYEQPA